MISRREWIVQLLTLPGFAGLAARGAAETAGKVSKTEAQYRDRPNDANWSRDASARWAGVFSTDRFPAQPSRRRRKI
jgi:hypothetical protein